VHSSQSPEIKAAAGALPKNVLHLMAASTRIRQQESFISLHHEASAPVRSKESYKTALSSPKWLRCVDCVIAFFGETANASESSKAPHRMSMRGA
jgi:hypothetical protein